MTKSTILQIFGMALLLLGIWKLGDNVERLSGAIFFTAGFVLLVIGIMSLLN